MSLRSPSAVAVLAAAVVLAAVVAACGVSTSTFPPVGSTPQPAGDETSTTTSAVIGALATAGLQAAPSVQTYRPAEGGLLAAAPRTTLQVALPDDPGHGYILIYAFPSPSDATAAANDQAAYLSTSIAKAYYPPGTSFVLRVVGSNVLFYSWLPASAPDKQTPEIERVLRTLGTEVQVPG